MRRETNTSEGHAKWQKSLDFIKKKLAQILFDLLISTRRVFMLQG